MIVVGFGQQDLRLKFKPNKSVAKLCWSWPPPGINKSGFDLQMVG